MPNLYCALVQLLNELLARVHGQVVVSSLWASRPTRRVLRWRLEVGRHFTELTEQGEELVHNECY